MSKELPETLYHYCNLQSLHGIIENKNLNMTNLFWMDDTTELFWFYDVVTRVLAQRPADARNVLQEQFDKVMKDHQLSHVYCVSFSEEPDSRNQWLEYADDGNGFAIGFDHAAFDLKPTKAARDVHLESVIYDKERQQRMAEEVIDRLEERGHEVADRIMLWATNYSTWRQAARCKNPVFENEAEWRLIFRGDPGDGLQFRQRRDRHLIPFIKFPFEPAKNPIREIWLGPRNQSQRNIDAVAQLLRVHGYDVGQVAFVSSEVPLRPEY